VTTATAPVDDLVRDLGALRVAADAVRAGVIARTAIEEAIWEATRAIGATIRQPDSPATIALAQDALGRTARLISALHSESARSRRIASAAAGLRLVSRSRSRRDWKA
jgi:hypothetical protein